MGAEAVVSPEALVQQALELRHQAQELAEASRRMYADANELVERARCILEGDGAASGDPPGARPEFPGYPGDLV